MCPADSGCRIVALPRIVASRACVRTCVTRTRRVLFRGAVRLHNKKSWSSDLNMLEGSAKFRKKRCSAWRECSELRACFCACSFAILEVNITFFLVAGVFEKLQLIHRDLTTMLYTRSKHGKPFWLYRRYPSTVFAGPIWRDCFKSETQPSLRPHFYLLQISLDRLLCLPTPILLLFLFSPTKYLLLKSFTYYW